VEREGAGADSSAPEGAWTVATGGAQRNPWEVRFSFVSAPEGRRNWAFPPRSIEGVRLAEFDAVSACPAAEFRRPSGATPNQGRLPLRVPLRSTRSYTPRPLRGRSLAPGAIDRVWSVKLCAGPEIRWTGLGQERAKR